MGNTAGDTTVVAAGSATSSGVQIASGLGATVGGGWNNTASGEGATVGGGWHNTASGSYSTVASGGGFDWGAELPVGNQARGDWSTIGGGAANQAFGRSSTVAGGGDVYQANVASGDWSTIGGGVGNKASQLSATVAGGFAGTASALDATVGGGSGNIASGDRSTVSGGRLNRARGAYAVVVGGGGLNDADSNSAFGDYSTVAGGTRNTAEGNYSFAAGRRAKAKHHGTFVWADNSVDADFGTTGNNQFLIRAAGNVGINTTSPTSPLTVAGEIYSTAGGIRFPDNSVQTTAAAGGNGGGGWSDDGSVVRLLTPGDNVGIGTTSPGAKLDVSGSVKIADGTQGANKVLTSDANGLATWQTPTGGANTSLSNLSSIAVNTSLVPGSDNAIDLGSSSLRWKTLHLGPGSLVVHNDAINTSRMTLDFSGSTARLATDAATPLNLTTGANTGLNINTTGKVGIGTTSPQQLFSVDGSAVIDQSGNNSGTISANALTFGSTSGEGIASKRTAGGNQFGLDFYAGSVSRLSIANGGFVGIGTTAPNQLIHAVADQNAARINMQSFGGIGAYRATVADGTAAAPLAFPASNMLGLQVVGYTGSAYSQVYQPVAIRSTETWSPSANGIRLQVNTVPSGTTTQHSSLVVEYGGSAGNGGHISNGYFNINEHLGIVNFITPDNPIGNTRGVFHAYDNTGSAGGSNFFPELNLSALRGYFQTENYPLNNDRLGRLGFGGWSVAAGNELLGATFLATATEAWGASAAGTKLDFSVTSNGSTTPSTAMMIDQNGNIGIGTTSPGASNLLELSSATKGLVLSRMTKTQRDAIASPVAGMMIYQTDNTPGLRVYNGANWMRFTETAD